MKIIHAADIHLGSSLSSISDKDIRDKRKSEVLHSFERMIDYAKENDIKIIMLSGDIFDNDNPTKKAKEYFYHLIEKNEDITFLYLKGNHDSSNEFNIAYKNLLLFSDSWQSYKFDNVIISGVELTKENAKAIYPSLKLYKENINIVMMHGDVDTKGDNYISLKDLKNKNIDYLALGHIHEKSLDKLDDRGLYAYSGCLEGRGYDESGEKGFYVLDIIDNKITPNFIVNSQRIIHSIDVDISNALSFGDVKDLINKSVIDISKDDIVRIYLVGDNQIDEDLDGLESFYNFFYISIKNKSKIKIDYKKYENDLSLKGEFVRTVLANNDLNEDEKSEIIYVGLKALNGEVEK